MVNRKRYLISLTQCALCKKTDKKNCCSRFMLVSQHVECELLILLFICEQIQSARDLVWCESAG